MAKKTYRRFIRLGSELVTSPRFVKKADADYWYDQMKVKKQFASDGLIAPLRKNDGIKFIDYARDWMRERMANYEAPTWMSDEQRLRDYILPYLSEMLLNRITSRDIRTILNKMTTEEKLSIATRTRVKALLSKMFSDAFNQELVPSNPVYGIKFEEKRQGKKKPVHIESHEECLHFLTTAKDMGLLHLTAASFTIMTGLRKSEILALDWMDVDLDKNVIKVTKRLQQATMTIKQGTKAGELETRIVPFSDDLRTVLINWKKVSKPGFLFQDFTGRFLGPKQFYNLINEVSEKAEIKVHVHGLRHTYGRSFAANSGNIKALQAILGHASSSTTDIYSELSGERLKGFGEIVKFGVKKSRD